MSSALREEKRKLREQISAERTRATLAYNRLRERGSNFKSYFSIGRQVALMTGGIRSIQRMTTGNKRSIMTWLRVFLMLPTAGTLLTYIVKLKKQARNAKLGKPDLPAT